MAYDSFIIKYQNLHEIIGFVLFDCMPGSATPHKPIERG